MFQGRKRVVWLPVAPHILVNFCVFEVAQGKLFLQQEQLLALQGVFVESLRLGFITFSSSARPGYLCAQKPLSISSKLLLQFSHPHCIVEKLVWFSFLYLRTWQYIRKLWCSAADSFEGNFSGFGWVFDQEFNLVYVIYWCIFNVLLYTAKEIIEFLLVIFLNGWLIFGWSLKVHYFLFRYFKIRGFVCPYVDDVVS